MVIGIDANTFRFPRAGISRYLSNVLKHLVNLCLKDKFILYSPRSINCGEFGSNCRIRIGNGPTSRLGSFWFSLQGMKYMVKDGIDVFWGQNQILPANLPKRIKGILTVHDLTHIRYPETMPEHSWIISKLLFKSAVSRADRIIAVSKSTAKDLVTFLNVPHKKIVVIYEGYDEKFRPVEKGRAKEYVRNKFRLDKAFILSVGTVSPRKNYPILIRAFSKIRKDYDYALVIVGTIGWKYRAILNLIKELAIDDKVKVLGNVSDNDLLYLYNAATVMIYPSLYEGFGLPVLEAMACGIPVICSNTSSLPEVGGDAVLYFNPFSDRELLRSLVAVLDSKKLRDKLSQKGLVQAEKFSFDKAAKEIKNIFYGR